MGKAKQIVSLGIIVLMTFFNVIGAQEKVESKSMLQQELKQERTDKTVKFFNDLTKDRLDLVDDFYHKDATLVDPIGDHKSRETIKSYYGMMYKPVTKIKFTFGEIIMEDDNLVLPWRMDYSSKKLKSGKNISVDGVSVLKWDLETETVIHHRDYFDMGEMVYEEVAILGRVVKWIKKMFQ